MKMWIEVLDNYVNLDFATHIDMQENTIAIHMNNRIMLTFNKEEMGIGAFIHLREGINKNMFRILYKKR